MAEIIDFQARDTSEVLTTLRAVEDFSDDGHLYQHLLNLADTAIWNGSVPVHSFTVEQSALIFSALQRRATQTEHTWDHDNAAAILRGSDSLAEAPVIQEAASRIPPQDDYPTGALYMDAELESALAVLV